jgi:hypothetical protein
MEKTKRFDVVPAYKQFVNKRDEALEQIFRNHRLKITDITDKAFVDALSVLQAKYPALIADPYNKRKLKQVDDGIDQIFDSVVQTIAWQQVMLRRAVYMLAHAGEAEAIARTLKTGAKLKLSYDEISKKAYDKLPDGTDLIKRIDLYFSDVRKKLLTAVEQALIFGDQPDEMLGRAFMALPKKKELPQKTVLKKVKKAKIAEARKPTFTGDPDTVSGVTFDFGPKGGVRISTLDWDNATWEQVHKLWHEDYSLTDRGPENFFDLKNPFSREPLRPELPEGDKIYGWELEQQLTHDFVKSVRDGQIDAANVNGINEFIWIAIIDQRTCELCCEWRSGLTTSEIEKTLADNPELKEHCDVVVPPAHFNCRCGIAPVAIDLETTDIQTTDAKEFDDWLNGN